MSAEDEAKRAKTAAGAGLPPITILLVDDDAFNREGVRLYLAREGFAVLEAGDEETAWQIFQARAPQSVFRGVVRPQGLASCDILQAWVDVSGHPSRGQEQADFIRQRVLEPLVQGI